MPRKKMSEEEKAEAKALREIDKIIEDEAKKEEKAEAKKVKAEEKKYGKRVHVRSAKIIHCRGIFVEEVLGGLPGDKQIYSTYVASKAPDAKTMAEEIAIYGEEEIEQQQTTVFPRCKNEICVIEYQMRGFLKSAAEALKRAGLLEVTAHKKVINDLIRISAKESDDKIDRFIPFHSPDGKKNVPYLVQRPLRAETAQGPRTALASSEALPAGTWFEFYMHLLSAKITGTVLSWMEYGKLNGLMQWRNAGLGRFRVEVDVDGEWKRIEDVESL